MKIHIGPCREFFVERGLLWNRAKHLTHLTRLPSNIKPQHPDLTARRHTQAADHIDRRRLTRTIWPQQSENLPLPHRQRKMIHRFERPKAFTQVDHLDSWHSGVWKLLHCD